MEFMNEESCSELLEAQVHLWNHALGFTVSTLLKCVRQLDIPEIIRNHGEPMTLSHLVASLPVHPTKAHGIYRLMRLLEHFGFFSRKKIHNHDQEEGYSLTPASRLLLKDRPLSVLALMLAGNHEPAAADPFAPWHSLSTWFQNTDPTPFYTVNGLSAYDFAAQKPSFNKMFNESMASDSELHTSVIIRECKGVFEGLTSLVDVGGGTGTVAKAIAHAFPHLNCTVLDQPHVVANLQGTKNLDFVGGDMFEAIPPANAIFLKWILHNWSDEESIKILKNCREAIRSKDKGGKVIIIDMTIDMEKGDKMLTETQLLFDMMMMVLFNGIERTEKEWEKLFLAAGFSHYKITHTLGLNSLIEVYP